MSLSDPISNMLTKIRNAILIKKNFIDVPFSNIKIKILEIFKNEGFITSFEVIPLKSFKKITINLRYVNDVSIIQKLIRESRPGLRKYANIKKIPQVLSGKGVLIISTPLGIMTDSEARKKNVGGEILLSIW